MIALVGCRGPTAELTSIGASAPSKGATEPDKQAYDACLSGAAKYIDDGKGPIEHEAPLVAALCYPQFSQYEKSVASGFSARARKTFNRESDQRQIDFASAAIRQERGALAFSGAPVSVR